jgi:hypothetical protein
VLVDDSLSLLTLLRVGGAARWMEGHRNEGGAGLPSATEDDAIAESSDKSVADGARERVGAARPFRRRRRL